MAKSIGPPILHAALRWQPPRSDVLPLWHGCMDSDRINITNNGIDLSFCRPNVDFGRGFYTTTLRRQAEQWAWQRHFEQQQTSPPVVLEFLVSRRRLARLLSLFFVNGDYDSCDYWSLVQHCRQSTPQLVRHHRGPQNGWYDVVSGPVAAMWRQRVAMAGADQVSFHTTQAVKLLKPMTTYLVH